MFKWDRNFYARIAACRRVLADRCHNNGEQAGAGVGFLREYDVQVYGFGDRE